MPSHWTVYQWLKKYPDFKTAYDEARSFQADTFVDEMIDIADNARNDWMERIGRDGQSLGWVENGEAVRRSALRVDTRKHLAGLLAPRKYGARVINEVGGIDGAPIEVATISTRDLAKATALLLAKGMRAKAEG